MSVTDDLNLHFVIILNPNVQHSVLWFRTDGKTTKEFVFDSFDTATTKEVTGFIEGVPMMTINTEQWEVIE